MDASQILIGCWSQGRRKQCGDCHVHFSYHGEHTSKYEAQKNTLQKTIKNLLVGKRGRTKIANDMEQEGFYHCDTADRRKHCVSFDCSFTFVLDTQLIREGGQRWRRKWKHERSIAWEETRKHRVTLYVEKNCIPILTWVTKRVKWPKRIETPKRKDHQLIKNRVLP